MRRLALLTLLASLAAWTGCTTSRLIENTRVPEVTIDEAGLMTYNGKQIQRGKLAAALKSAGLPKTQEINIRIPDMNDRALMKSLSAELVQGGYTRTIFVTPRKATSTLSKPQ
jgi:hypothetical protein